MDKHINAGAASNKESTYAAQPFLDEIYKAPAARATIANDSNGIAEFGRNFAAGVVSEGKDFVKFLSVPYSVNKSWLQIGPQLDTAYDYYKSKIFSGQAGDIVRDAGIALGALKGFVNECGVKSPAKKAELMGRATFQIALSEISTPSRLNVNMRLPIGAGLASTEPLALTKEIEAALDCSQANYIGGAEKVLHIGARNLGASPEFALDMQQILTELPVELRQALRERDIEFKAVKAINDVVVEPIDNGRGLYRPDNNSIYLAETFKCRDGWISDAATEPRILRHEIGHALDHMKVLDQWVSDSPAMCRAFYSDVAKMTDSRREFLEHFTAPDTGRREAFAEAYAILHTPAVDADRGWREQFCKSFPSMMRQVQATKLP